MPTKNDVVTFAHRLIGILSADEVPTADQDAYAGAVLDAIFAELQTAQNMTLSWTLASVPSAALIGLAETLASDIAAHYGLSYKSRAYGIARLRASEISDDRESSKDLDGDGTVTESEAETAAYGLYY